MGNILNKHVLPIIFVGLAGLAGIARADLKSPFSLENPDVLPAGVRNPRFINIVMSIDSKLGSTGTAEPLGAALNKPVTWFNVLGAIKDPAQKQLFSANIGNLDGSPGSTTGQVGTFASVLVPAMAWGASDKLTLGLAVPVIRVDVSADTGFVRSVEGETVRSQIAASAPGSAYDLATKLNDSVNQKLTGLGYDPVHSMQVSGIGDAQLFGKYRFYQDGVNAVSCKTVLTIPTGIAPNADKALDVPTGDGRFQVGETLIYGRVLPLDLKWNSSVGYAALLPNTMVKRIPTEAGSSISGDKELLHRNMQYQASAGTSLNYYIDPIGVNVGSGYNVQYLSRTTYEPGISYDPIRYSYVEGLSPSQTLHSLTLAAGFSTVDWFKAKKFFYPFQANLGYSRPLSGRNVTSNDVYAGELVLFF